MHEGLGSVQAGPRCGVPGGRPQDRQAGRQPARRLAVSLCAHLLERILLGVAARLLLDRHQVLLALQPHLLVLKGQVLWWGQEGGRCRGAGAGWVTVGGDRWAERRLFERRGRQAESRWGLRGPWPPKASAFLEWRCRAGRGEAGRARPEPRAAAQRLSRPGRGPTFTCAAWRPEPTWAPSPISTSSTASFLAFLAGTSFFSAASRLAPAFLPARVWGRRSETLGGRRAAEGRRWTALGGAPLAGAC